MVRFDIPDNPEVGWIESTGYPSWMQDEDDDEFYEDDQDAYEAFCDHVFEESRERELFGD